MKSPRPDLAGYALCALLCLCITVLAVFSRPVPEMLTVLAFAALTGGASLSLNSQTETLPRASAPARATSSAPPAAAPAPAPRPRPAEPAPAPAPAAAPAGLL